MKGNLKYLFNNKAIQILVTLLIIVILIYVVFKTFTLLFHLTAPSNSKEVSSVSSIRDIFIILFYIIIATITILSYLQARKTLFTPIKTEVFKLQIRSFEEILIFFQAKKHVDFMEFFDFPKMVRLNALELRDDYIDLFFKNDIEIDVEKRKEASKEIVGSVVSKDYADQYFVKPDYARHNEKSKVNEKSVVTNPSLILDKWHKHKHGKIDFTDKYKIEYEKLEHLIASPLLPQKLKVLITEFKEKIVSNLLLIGEVLTEISQEMPHKFPSAESMLSFNTTGIWNKYHPKTKKLDDDIAKILTFINDYFRIEKLID